MEQTTQHPLTLQDRVRRGIDGRLRQVGAALHRWGVHPDLLTLVGTLIVGAGAVCIGLGDFGMAALLLLIGLPLDALDGAVARAMQRRGRFGAVLDSTLDRCADAVIFCGFAYYFASQDALHYMLLSLAALTGSFVVSYVRARAGEVDLDVRVGWLDRMARLALVLAALLLPVLLIPALWVLAVGSHVTVLQRIWYVYRHLDRG